MIIGIDASNIRSGGGITHLKELLENADPSKYGFNKVILWSGKKTLDQIKESKWLIKSEQALLNKSLPYITYWQQTKLDKLVKAAGCDLLFCPAGTYIGKHKPYVVMSQNMLIFEKKERARYGISPRSVKFKILEKIQTKSFKNSSGIIFISNYAKKFISNSIDISKIKYQVINHGISDRFRQAHKLQLSIQEYNFKKPFHLLYVSTIDIYKHQWNVIEAVALLRKRGFPLELILIGDGSFKPALKKLNQSILSVDPKNEFIKYFGSVSFNEISENYKSANAFIFASSCENFSNIVVEAMASGLPVACSNKSVMPEILKDAGFYFDPEDNQSINDALEEMLNSTKEREIRAQKAFEYSKQYSWVKCANETFRFIKEVTDNYYIKD